LRGTQIPLGARIIAIAEAYSAMISERPYRPALSRRTATGELRHQAGKRYDPELVALFVGLLPKLADPQTGELETAQAAPARQERSPAGDGIEALATSATGAPDEAVAGDAGVTAFGDPAYEPPIFPTRDPIVAPMASVAPLAGGRARPRRPLPTRSVKQPPPAEPAATRNVEQETTGVLAAAGPSAQPAAAATAEPGDPPPVEAADARGAEPKMEVMAPQVAPGEDPWDVTTLAAPDERDDDEGADGQVARIHMIRREAERDDDEGADADGEGQPVESMKLEDTLIGPGSETDFFLRAAAERFKVRNTGYFYPWDVDE